MIGHAQGGTVKGGREKGGNMLVCQGIVTSGRERKTCPQSATKSNSAESKCHRWCGRLQAHRAHIWCLVGSVPASALPPALPALPPSRLATEPATPRHPHSRPRHWRTGTGPPASSASRWTTTSPDAPHAARWSRARGRGRGQRFRRTKVQPAGPWPTTSPRPTVPRAHSSAQHRGQDQELCTAPIGTNRLLENRDRAAPPPAGPAPPRLRIQSRAHVEQCGQMLHRD
eukprot:scaffold7422_cov134-Isochrysis_galbana.AAC.14